MLSVHAISIDSYGKTDNPSCFARTRARSRERTWKETHLVADLISLLIVSIASFATPALGSALLTTINSRFSLSAKSSSESSTSFFSSFLSAALAPLSAPSFFFSSAAFSPIFSGRRVGCLTATSALSYSFRRSPSRLATRAVPVRPEARLGTETGAEASDLCLGGRSLGAPVLVFSLFKLTDHTHSAHDLTRKIWKRKKDHMTNSLSRDHRETHYECTEIIFFECNEDFTFEESLRLP